MRYGEPLGRIKEKSVCMEIYMSTNRSTPGVKFSEVHIPADSGDPGRFSHWEYWEAAMQEKQDSLDAHVVMDYLRWRR